MVAWRLAASAIDLFFSLQNMTYSAIIYQFKGKVQKPLSEMRGADDMRKKLWFVFLMILSLSIICAVSAAEKSGTCGKDGDNLTWKLSDQGVLTISGSGDMVDYNKEIFRHG